MQRIILILPWILAFGLAQPRVDLIYHAPDALAVAGYVAREGLEVGPALWVRGGRLYPAVQGRAAAHDTPLYARGGVALTPEGPAALGQLGWRFGPLGLEVGAWRPLHPFAALEFRLGLSLTWPVEGGDRAAP